MTIYYVYYSYEEWGRGYIGKRKCPVDKTPETDNYFGSYSDKNFNPNSKIILEVFKTDAEASEAEYKLQRFFKVVENPHFANQCYQKSSKFSSEGRKVSKETRQKISDKNKNKKPWNKNVSHSVTTKAKISSSLKGRQAWNKGLKSKTPSKSKGRKNIKVTMALLSRAKKYVFTNYKTNENITSTVRDMVKNFGGNKQGYYRIINKTRVMYRDWKFIDNQQPDT